MLSSENWDIVETWNDLEGAVDTCEETFWDRTKNEIAEIYDMVDYWNDPDSSNSHRSGVKMLRY